MYSELDVNWMTGEYRTKKEHIRYLFDKANKYAQRFRSVEYFHYSRETELAKKVDELAKLEFTNNQE